ncbi:hypothetical protein ACJIZ3_013835 [Penstemon smallii]|uniref:F-box domain-containing protein n=1 Tax=Penstemon smallii TaxID=265156 RepID=A0ABD3RHT7_9LAMI
MNLWPSSFGSETIIGLELPEDVMIQILVCLPVKSIVRFRCVSKSWCALLKSASFINKHILSQRGRDVLLVRRCLFPPQKDGDILSFHDPDSPTLEEVSPNLPIPFLKDIRGRYHRSYVTECVFILGPCNGLVCIFYGEFIILCNPALREFKWVPPCPFVCPQGCFFSIRGWGFGNTSDNNNFKVVLLQSVDPEVCSKPHIMVNLYQLTTNSWKQIDVGNTIQLEEVNGLDYLQLFFNGACHWDAKHDGMDSAYAAILCFDVNTEVFRWLDYPDTSTETETETGDYWRSLFVINECLAVVWYVHWEEGRPIYIWVMKEYGVKESWSKQFVIGPFVDYLYPFLAWKNDWLLLDKAEKHNIHQLVSYSFNTNQLKKYPLYGKAVTFRALIYKESLFSLHQVI